MRDQEDEKNNVQSSQIEIDDDAIIGISRKHRRLLDKKKIEKLRSQNEQEKREAFKKRQERKVLLMSLSKPDKKTFLIAEQEKERDEKEHAQQLKQQQRNEFLSMSPAEKKAFLRNRKKQRHLQRRAKKSYVPLQIMKYVLLGVLLAGLVYAGDIAYGAFIDNTAAFQDTQEAVAKPTQTATPKPSATASEKPTPTPTPDPYDLLLDQADLDFMKNRVNILVLGIDESFERANWGTFRTDTMLLLSIDFDTNDVYMLSLPRDSYVWIYNKDVRDKINSAFSAGGGYEKSGFEYAMNTVSMVLGGVPVNHYVCFDMNVVKEVVDAIGGLNYDVDINVKMNGRIIEKGYQFLDGQKVLDYCRQRKGDSDIARVDRQQRMILAIFEAVKSTGQLGDVPAIYSAVTGNIYTDLTPKQIASLAAFAMKIDLNAIERYTLPGGFLNIDGTSFWGVDLYKTRDLVEDIFGVRIKINKADDLDTLQALAQEKRNAVSAAKATVKSAKQYVKANKAVVTAEELTEFNNRATSLLALADVKNTEDVSLTIAPLTAAIDEFNTWFTAFQTAIEVRKAEAAATPTPLPEEPPLPEESPAA